MLSDVSAYPVTTVAGLEVNTLADGFFHVVTWCCVLIAPLLTWDLGFLAFGAFLVVVGLALYRRGSEARVTPSRAG